MSDETPEAAYRMLHERARGALPAAGDRSLSAAQYDAERSRYLADVGIVAKPGVAVWPPTSQTLMKRLGGGSWASAMAALGLTANAGRARGSSAFSDDDYRAAVGDFLTAAADSGDESVTSTSFSAYVVWAKATSGERKRPSGAAVRQHFGSWEAAKAAAQPADPAGAPVGDVGTAPRCALGDAPTEGAR